MQPIYVTQASTTPVFKTCEWWTAPQEIAFAIISSGGSSYTLAVCYEDPSFTYPSPKATGGTSNITTFTLINAASNAQVVLPSSMKPISGYSFVLSTATAGSSVNVELVTLQSGKQ